LSPKPVPYEVDIEALGEFNDLLRVTALIWLDDLVGVHKHDGYLGGANEFLKLRDFRPLSGGHFRLRLGANPMGFVDN